MFWKVAERNQGNTQSHSFNFNSQGNTQSHPFNFNSLMKSDCTSIIRDKNYLDVHLTIHGVSETDLMLSGWYQQIDWILMCRHLIVLKM